MDRLAVGESDRRVAKLAAREWGVLSSDELATCGLSRDEILTRSRRGWLHRRHHRVYAVGHPNLTPQGRFLAAVKACGPGAVLSHRAAAVLWGMLEWGDCTPEVLITGTAPRRHHGIRAHRTQSLPAHAMRRHQGIPVTAPLRTLVDLASVVRYGTLRGAVRRAQALQFVHHRGLVGALRENRGRRGIRNLRRIVASGPAPTRSVLEDVVLDLILDGGLTRPDVNVPLFVAGRSVVPDFRWAAEKLIVEADSRKWHDTPLARQDDAERQALLEAFGERVVRVTWEQAVREPDQTLLRLRAAGAPSSSVT